MSDTARRDQVIVTAKGLGSFRRARGRIAALAGVALGACMFASGAEAQCSGTGLAAAFGGPAAAAANSLISTIDNANTAFLAGGQTAFVGSPTSQIPDFTAGGVWVRGIGGEVNTSSTGTVTSLTVGGVPVGGVSCNTKVHEDYGGVQIGMDVAKLNLGASGENIHFGVTAGYSQANVTDNFGGSDNIQVPFVGAYSVLTYGRFFASLMTQFNFFQNALSQSSLAVNNQGLDAVGYSVAGSAGYQFDLGHNWFIEPSVSVIDSSVRVDTLNAFGGSFIPGFVQFNDIQSLLGRAGLRVGTSFDAGGWAFQPFVGASVWNEFDSPATASYSSAVPGFATGTLTSSRVGTYGDYSAGIASQVLNSGWLSYVRVDVLDGEFINGWGVNGGLRYQFDPGAGGAGPGIFKAPVYKAPAELPYVWTGLYGGGVLGAAFGETQWLFNPPGTTTNPGVNGILGGLDVGYNQQVGPWVLGVEGDIVWTNANGAEACPNAFVFTCHNDTDALATFAGRLGYAWDRALFYVKGGGAWMDGSVKATCNDATGAACGGTSQSANESRFGATVGAGVEFGLTANWSAKAEYDFLDFGTQNFILFASPFQVREDINEVKIGVNYRFPVTPVVARD